MNERQVLSHRPSYINAILIQSRGRPEVQACIACRSGPGLHPFPECRRLPGHFGGACGNCKWRDHASRCSVRDDEDVVEVIDVLDSDNEGGNGGPRVITDGSTPASALLVRAGRLGSLCTTPRQGLHLYVGV
ncbi:hypothetical protein AJ79_02055 [Helicocarpus griseus UAMH5409]|uniref:Uncharacterized protein n=1 Tax=Helicocarpus griseus UAMH5409 TaxID=1447875 RepID=A0A2B7Y4V2_9EURO|nr:hypothetical protein AJ79_02055 [Helicocarpus griseus UAMH5409]